MADTTVDTYGFPAGYFLIRSLASNRLVDVDTDAIEDGTEVILWPGKENSLVEYLRNPEANNQVFFIDTSGALCSRSSGHAIGKANSRLLQDDRLVLRHRRPISYPYPNSYSHPVVRFSFDGKTKEISVTFPVDPVHYSTGDPRSVVFEPQSRVVLASIPKRKPPSFVDNAGRFFQSNLVTPFQSNVVNPLTHVLPNLSPMGSPSTTSANPEQVFDGRIELGDDDTLESERGEEGEVDDSPDKNRRLRLVKIEEGRPASDAAIQRRQWEIIPLRRAKAHTGAL
ncbi:hypothetical protein PUNSTDRAFT_95209 [Punctularia strigosozonata HHB-11173 SS5]|uniref:uncharacterized protein n=1 Tax=Punctularia strigosozonata (strain HHB-11173) TaxID=741275 RepID=UPI0004416E0C|nr:uncharacterized protein PUNSTDRAFT_95209 [Punctularia strigosozonata HHB-11173 SS5]EIN13847.1 hypothetical protein PUNSTDRAFT_95209 [Punctularia strigosozonata HHB-11173 SS5]